LFNFSIFHEICSGFLKVSFSIKGVSALNLKASEQYFAYTIFGYHLAFVLK
jgi:hypothetical protein